MGKPIYEKSAIQLVKDFAQQYFSSGGSSFTLANLQSWISQHYPLLPLERIKTNLTILSTNSPARRNHPVHQDLSNDVLFVQENGTYRAFNRDTDPPPSSKPA